MITDHQKEYIERLYSELGQELNIDLDNLTRAEGHKAMQELLQLKNEVE